MALIDQNHEDTTNDTLSSLKEENEKLRLSLDNLNLELELKVAANVNLKEKIGQLYVEAQNSLQEKQQLRNSLKDAENRLASAESSTRFYRLQLHELQAEKKSLQSELDICHGIIKQRQLNSTHFKDKCHQLNSDYKDLLDKYKRDVRELRKELQLLKFRYNEKLKLKDAKIALNNNSGESSLEVFGKEEETESEESLRECLERTLKRNKELKVQLDLARKLSEENIDEGYSDYSSPVINVARPLNLTLPASVGDILAQSRNLLAPLQKELDELQSLMTMCQHEQNTNLSSTPKIEHSTLIP